MENLKDLYITLYLANIRSSTILMVSMNTWGLFNGKKIISMNMQALQVQSERGKVVKLTPFGVRPLVVVMMIP